MKHTVLLLIIAVMSLKGYSPADHLVSSAMVSVARESLKRCFPADHPVIEFSAALPEDAVLLEEIGLSWVRMEPASSVFDSIYFTVQEPIYDVLIRNLYNDISESPVETHESDGTFVFEMEPGQWIKIKDPFPFTDPYNDYHFLLISYTREDGQYETVKISGSYKNPVPEYYESYLSADKYKKDYFNNEFDLELGLYSEELRERILAGDFEDYVPNGLYIAGGSLGDVNGDGIEDALLSLMSAGEYCMRGYQGDMPLYILIGLPEGGYVIQERLLDILSSPFRSPTFAVAGTGYIDIISRYDGNAFCYHEDVGRYWYQPEAGEWEKGTALTVSANAEHFSFQVQNDIWQLDEYDDDAFHMVKD